MSFNKTNLSKMLKSHARKITFTKANGSKRKMCASLLEHDLPEGNFRQKPNPELITVWDLQARGFRSIRVDTIISVDLA